MARRKTRVKDRWRDKRWITIQAPEPFGKVRVADVPITDDDGAKGRVIETTLFDILEGDQSQHQYKIYFKISGIADGVASTIFKGYEYSKEYLRSLVRRGSSKINFITDASTKDGHTFRIKVIVLTNHRLNTSRQHTIRLLIKNMVETRVPLMEIDEFVQSACYGKIDADIMAEAKKIVRVRHVGLEKVKLIKTAEEQITLLKA